MQHPSPPPRRAITFAARVWDTYYRVGVPRSAAALAYFFILTLFPLLMCLHYLIGLFHLDLQQLLDSLVQVLPNDVLTLVTDYLHYVTLTRSPALLYAGLLTIVLSASAGLRTLFLTLDELHGVHRDSGLGRIALSIALSVLFLLTIYLSIVVIFTGDWFFLMLKTHLPAAIVNLLPLDALNDLWQWLRYLLLFCAVLILVLIVYRIGTPKSAVSQKILLTCAVLSALAMALTSVIFSWFISFSSRYALVYGSLASMMILLAWLYSCGNILLLGAVIGHLWGQGNGG